ncbi:alpha/beta hydrolase [Thalassobellus sediminis]|uniref:alpha/beta hydrolase n=1 Tax=Thalassobellus sediminis TaxID=3367753 RepID=UPI0037BC128B
MKKSFNTFIIVFTFLNIFIEIQAQTLTIKDSTALAFDEQNLEDPILLWPNGAPNATGTSDEDKPAITPFIPEVSKRNGTAVLVIPGGGFVLRAKDHEGVLVAQWLKEQGFTAFLLRYRLRPIYRRTEWLMDGQRALQYIRAHASKYNISTERLGAVGFSAGANLCADLAFSSFPGNSKSTDALDRQPTNPNFIMLAYGYGELPATLESFPKANMPPIFMYGTAEDSGSYKGMVKMHSNLLHAKIPVETHFFQTGNHGTGFAIGDPILGQWPYLAKNWLWANGLLTDKPRTSLSGSILLDGKPLVRGSVIMTSIDDPNAPPVIIYQNNSGTGKLGLYSVPKNEGPVAGTYKIEVRQGATRWTSNSRDPFIIEMMDKQRKGELTKEDIEKWTVYHRARDLSPSIYNQRVFTHQHPNDKKEYSVHIKEGMELNIEIFSK